MKPKSDAQLHKMMIEPATVDESKVAYCRFSEIEEQTVSAKKMASMLENRACLDTRATFDENGSSVSVTTAGG